MSMNVPGMAAAIKASILILAPMTTVDQFALALADAIVLYIQNNATVPATGLVAPAGGGPVTGQATVL